MAIHKGDLVKIEYEGRFETGEVFDSSKHGDHSHPLEFLAGSGEVIAGMDKTVIGMKKDDEKEIIISSNEAYGDYDKDLKKQIPRNAIPKEPEPKVGMVLIMTIADGDRFPVKIVEVDDNFVTIDLNHPLAGKTLHFKIKILDVKKSLRKGLLDDQDAIDQDKHLDIESSKKDI